MTHGPVLASRWARGLAVGVLTAAAVLAAAYALLGALVGYAEATLGAQVFDGRTPVVARIEGHSGALPAEAAACANCHRPSAAPVGAALAAASFGPVLERDGLTRAVSRRGGPPSRFDERSFCRLLRTGEDPAGVLLPRAMPRYELDDAACLRLWRHLTASSTPTVLAATTR